MTDHKSPHKSPHKSTADRLAALKGEAPIDKTQAEIDRLNYEREEDRAKGAAAAAAEATKAARAAEKPTETAARLLKGDDKKNVKNLYGLTDAFASAGHSLVTLGNKIGLTPFFNACATVWEKAGPVRTAFDVAAYVPKKVVQGWWAAEKWGFEKLAYTTDEAGERRVSNKRGAAYILASLAMTGAIVGAVPPTLDLIYDVGMYAATVKTETMWMTGTDTVDEDQNIYTAGACHELPCNESNSVYYKIRPSLFLEAKSLLDSKGANYWQPETQVSAIPEITSKCTVTSAGIRFKPLKWYPYIVDTECSHRMESAMPLNTPLDTSSPPPVITVQAHAPAHAPAVQ